MSDESKTERQTANGAEPAPAESPAQPLPCGLIMPISALDGCSAEHWTEVQAIVIQAVKSIATPRFTVGMGKN